MDYITLRQLREHRAARLGSVLERLQAQARASGAAKLSDEVVLTEIEQSRAGRVAPTASGANAHAPRRKPA